MKTRVISGACLLAVMAAMIFISVYTRILFFFIVGVLCIREYCGRLAEKGIKTVAWVMYGEMIVFLILALTRCGPMTYISTLIFSVCFAFFSAILNHSISCESVIYTVFGLCYPGFVCGLIMIIGGSEHWHQALALGFLPSIICDAFCLFGGRLWGKTKLCPQVSPNKTWEGSLTGAASSVISGVLIYFLCKAFAPLPLWFCIVTSLFSSTAGQVGDLAESLLKRHIGVKDFSNLIPGHGGMFDRADALIFSIPTAYLCIYFVYYFNLV